MSEPDAFGYREDKRFIREPHSFEVAEAKETDTLQPRVILYVRLTPDAEQGGLAMTPDTAEQVASELLYYAKRAREKHWEQ